MLSPQIPILRKAVVVGGGATVLWQALLPTPGATYQIFQVDTFRAVIRQFFNFGENLSLQNVQRADGASDFWHSGIFRNCLARVPLRASSPHYASHQAHSRKGQGEKQTEKKKKAVEAVWSDEAVLEALRMMV